ncbi:YncE family protein [Actinomadura nitritigenes]|uniref:YncE family protein n=1 Tax=Actinomadura nitritigenes TaxID=134602 RepID=UPI003D918CC6
MRRRIACTLALTGLSLAATPAASAAETWQQTSRQTYYLTDALQRSQGIATDGTTWYFSWKLGLSRVTLDSRTVLVNNPLAIPAQLAAQGANHIGDIDYYNGKIYAPIEDGSDYQHPYIALYDATTLTYTGTAYALPLSVQPDGAPWVAVDAARGYVYSSAYNPTPALNVYSLADLHLVKTVPLSTTIGSIQGAKIYQGDLYASSNNDAKSIYRIDPDTGQVTDVFDRASSLPSGSETEGLAFLPTSDGAQMHALDAVSGRLATYLYNYRQTTS